MKGVELYGRVRYAVQIEGLSHREAARRFGVDPRGLPCRKWSESRVRIGPLLNGERHAASAIYVRADHREAA